MKAPGLLKLLAAARDYRAGGPGPKATLIVLMEQMGLGEDGRWMCWPSMDEIAHETEQSKGTVRRHIAGFEAAGLVVREARGRSGGGRASNRFVLDVSRLMGAEQSAHDARIHDEQSAHLAGGKARIHDEQSAHLAPPYKEEQPENDQEQPQPLVAAALFDAPDTVTEVFLAWKESTGRNGTTKLDSKRRRIITRALKDYPLPDVLDAVRGWKASPHHRGENPTATVYNDLELLLRDAAHIERFRDLARRKVTARQHNHFS